MTEDLSRRRLDLARGRENEATTILEMIASSQASKQIEAETARAAVEATMPNTFERLAAEGDLMVLRAEVASLARVAELVAARGRTAAYEVLNAVQEVEQNGGDASA